MPRWKDTNTVVTRICHNSNLQSLNKVNFKAFGFKQFFLPMF